MNNHGHIGIGNNVHGYFSTHDSTGANVAPSSAFEDADVVVYESGNATQKTAGITVTSPFDTETGLHHYVIDTSNAAYSRNRQYTIMLAPDETVDGATITAIPIGTFDTLEPKPPGGFVTSIATWTSNTNFTLTDGPTSDDALNGFTLTLYSVAGNEAGLFTIVRVTDYTGSTKTITGTEIQGGFTAAASDIVVGVPARVIYDSQITMDVNAIEWAGDPTQTTDVALATAPTNFADLAIAAGDGRVEANVEEFGGVNGTFASGLPEVNLAQWLGTAPLALSSQRVQTLVGAMASAVVTAAAIATDAIDADALAADAVTEITDDIMAEIVETEGSYTVQQVLSVILAVLAGESSSGGATIATPNGNATRVAATVDGSNNRTAMTITPSS